MEGGSAQIFSRALPREFWETKKYSPKVPNENSAKISGLKTIFTMVSLVAWGPQLSTFIMTTQPPKPKETTVKIGGFQPNLYRILPVAPSHSPRELPNAIGGPSHTSGELPNFTGGPSHTSGALPNFTGDPSHTSGALPNFTGGPSHTSGALPNFTGGPSHTSGALPVDGKTESRSWECWESVANPHALSTLGDAPQCWEGLFWGHFWVLRASGEAPRSLNTRKWPQNSPSRRWGASPNVERAWGFPTLSQHSQLLSFVLSTPAVHAPRSVTPRRCERGHWWSNSVTPRRCERGHR